MSGRTPPKQPQNFDALVLHLVGRIPKGCVATYGQIAALAGKPRNSRQVGKILGRLSSKSTVPWHRVVNAQGRISQRAEPHGTESLQRRLLEAEGITFTKSGRIRMMAFAWEPSIEEFLGSRLKS